MTVHHSSISSETDSSSLACSMMKVKILLIVTNSLINSIKPTTELTACPTQRGFKRHLFFEHACPRPRRIFRFQGQAVFWYGSAQTAALFTFLTDHKRPFELENMTLHTRMGLCAQICSCRVHSPEGSLSCTFQSHLDVFNILCKVSISTR